MSVSKKIGKVMLTILTITVALYIYEAGFQDDRNLSKVVENWSQKRNLLTKADLTKFCNSTALYALVGGNTVGSLMDTLSNQTNSILNSVGFLGIKEDPASVELLKNLLKSVANGGTPNMNDVQTYAINRAGPYVIFFVFFVISLIGWIVFAACCCCPRCCCARAETAKQEAESNCCRCTSVVIVIICSAGIVILCILAFIYTTSFAGSMSLLTCNLITLIYDGVNGEDKTTTPLFIGLTGTKSMLTDALVQIDQIVKDANTKFSKLTGTWTTDDPNNLTKEIKAIYDKYSTIKITSPNPSNPTTSIAPIYASELGPPETTSKFLYACYTEVNTFLQGLIKSLQNFQTYSNQITQASNTIKNALNQVLTILNDALTQFNSMETSIITPASSATDYFQQFGNLATNIFFAVILGLVVLNVIALLLYCCCNKGCQCIRFLSHISWCTLALLMLLTFLLGGVLGALGLIMTDGGGFLDYIFSEQNLKTDKFLLTGDVATYVNTCFNGDGDLSVALGLNSGSLTQVNGIITESTSLLAYTSDTTKLQASNVVPNLKITFTDMKDDIRKSYKGTDADAPTNAFIEWYKYTDSSYPNTYQGSCTTKTKDRYTQSKTQCESGYAYLGAGNPQAQLGTADCLVISEWATDSKTRYPSCTVSNFGTLQAANDKFYTSITNYITQNSKNLDLIMADLDKYSNDFGVTGAKIISVINDLKSLIQSISNLINKFVSSGSGGFGAVFNCKVLGTDIKALLGTMKGRVGPDSLKLAIILGINAILIGALCTFEVIAINRYRYTDEDRDSEEKELAAQEQAAHQEGGPTPM